MTKAKRKNVGFILSLKTDWEKNHQLYILSAPFVILFSLFTLLPVLISVVLSFTNFNMLEFPKWLGVENYIKMFFDDEVFQIALVNTLKIAVITGPLSYIFCFVMAWLINELPPKIRSFVTLVFYAPALTGNIYFIWQYIFSGDQYGFLNNFLMQNGFILEPVQWLTDARYMLTVIMIVQLWASLGISFLSFIAGLQSVDVSMYEAAAIDGIRNRWQEMWYVTLPSMKPQLLFGAIMQISGAFSVGGISSALVGFPSKGYAAHTIVLHINDYGTVRYEMGYACALTVILFLMMLIFKSIVSRILAKVGE